ncbi:MAG: hypothetical protein JOZ40_11805 [Methylobacteriaceae bacterium]|nr:hypothetical protein [Methylobacteriaceae bacterium]
MRPRLLLLALAALLCGAAAGYIAFRLGGVEITEGPLPAQGLSSTLGSEGVACGPFKLQIESDGNKVTVLPQAGGGSEGLIASSLGQRMTLKTQTPNCHFTLTIEKENDTDGGLLTF